MRSSCRLWLLLVGLAWRRSNRELRWIRSFDKNLIWTGIIYFIGLYLLQVAW